jgi:hypothetical protein
VCGPTAHPPALPRQSRDSVQPQVAWIFRWFPTARRGIHATVLPADHERFVEAAELIIGAGGWFVLEVCLDIPKKGWEPRIVICRADASAVADAVRAELELEPALDARLTWSDRATWLPVRSRGAHLVHLAHAQTAPVTHVVPRARAPSALGLCPNQREEALDHLAQPSNRR